MGKYIEQGGVQATLKKAKKGVRIARSGPCDRPPVAPTGVNFFSFLKHHRTDVEYSGVVIFDAATADTDGFEADVQHYNVEVRATNAAGNVQRTYIEPGDITNTVRPAKWKARVPALKSPDTNEKLHAVLPDHLLKPKVWYYQARVQAVDSKGREGPWSSWTSPAQATAITLVAPPAVTSDSMALTIQWDPDKRHAVWVATVTFTGAPQPWTAGDGDQYDDVEGYWVHFRYLKRNDASGAIDYTATDGHKYDVDGSVVRRWVKDRDNGSQVQTCALRGLHRPRKLYVQYRVHTKDHYGRFSTYQPGTNTDGWSAPVLPGTAAKPVPPAPTGWTTPVWKDSHRGRHSHRVGALLQWNEVSDWEYDSGTHDTEVDVTGYWLEWMRVSGTGSGATQLWDKPKHKIISAKDDSDADTIVKTIVHAGIYHLNYYEFRVRAMAAGQLRGLYGPGGSANSGRAAAGWSAAYRAAQPSTSNPPQPISVAAKTKKLHVGIKWADPPDPDNSAVRDKDVHGYRVQVASNSNFATILEDKKVGGANIFWYPEPTSGAHRYLRVCSFGAEGRVSNWVTTDGKVMQNTQPDGGTTSGTDTDSLVPVDPDLLITGEIVSDGAAPSSSPTPTVLGGPTFLYTKWTPITNADRVTIEVHMSTTSGFTPGAGTKVQDMSDAGSYIIKKTAGGSDLAYGTTYYVKLIAKDVDGAAAASSQASATMVQLKGGGGTGTGQGGGDFYAGTILAGDIAVGTITADRMNVTTLSAITADIGLVTAGTFQTGKSIASGGSGTYIKLSSAINDTIQFYTSDSLKGGITTGASSVFMTNSNGNTVLSVGSGGITLFSGNHSYVISLNDSLGIDITGDADLTGHFTATKNFGAGTDLANRMSPLDSGGAGVFSAMGSIAGFAFWRRDKTTIASEAEGDQWVWYAADNTGARLWTSNRDYLRIEPTPAGGSTALWILANVAGTTGLNKVTFGATDSGGSGFRLLRIPN